MTIIKTKGLIKEYSRFEKEEGLKGSIKSLFSRKKIIKVALSSFDLEVKEGEFIGLIGPNGAGKTTLIKMLTGIIAPSRGKVEVLGYTPNHLKNEYKRQFAVVMGQKSQLFFELTAADSFLLLKEIYDIEENQYRENLEYFTHIFGVKEFLNVQVRTLSLGERMKMELIAALLHNPKILFLDESTIGLDAMAQKQIRNFLKKVNEEKKTTIILTSHYMEDIKSLCKRCVVVNGGEKIYDGGLKDLFKIHETHKIIKISFEEPCSFSLPNNVEVLKETPFFLSFMLPKGEVKSVLKRIMDECEISDISIEEEDIGNVIERIYEARVKIDAIAASKEVK